MENQLIKLNFLLPSIISDQYKQLNENDISKKPKFSNPEKIDPHGPDGWEFHTYLTYKFLADNLKPPLVNTGFTHNAV